MNESKLIEGQIAPFHISQDLEDLARVVAEISGKLAPILDFSDLIEETVRLIQQAFKYDQVILYLADPSHRQLALKVLASANYDQIIRSNFLKDELSLARLAMQENCLIRIHDLESEAPRYYQAEAGFHSELHLPLEYSGGLMGVLSLRSRKRKVFKDHNIFALRILVSQIALLIEKTSKDQWGSLVQSDRQLLEATRHSPEVDFQAILPNIQDLAGIQETFQGIVNRLVNELGYPGAMVAVIDETGQNLSLQAMAFDSRINSLKIKGLNLLELVEKTLDFRVIGAYQSLVHDQEGLGVKACLSGQTQFSHNLYDLFRPVVNQKLCGILQKVSRIKTCISIPLMLKGRAVGNLYVATKSNQISNDDLQKLQLFANSAAIAIKFEQLNEGLTRQVLQLTQLRNIERDINHSLQDIEKVLERILMGALELTRVPTASGHLVLVGKYASRLIDRVSYPKYAIFNSDRPGITQWIIRDRKPIYVDDIEKVRQIDVSIRNLVAGHSKIKSHLGVPILWRQQELVGVINIGSPEAKAFDKQSLLLLEQIAVQAAIAISNAYRFKEQEEMQRRLASIEQVVAMGDMAGNMVHKINNWVGSIRANADYLLSQHQKGQINHDELMGILDDMFKNAEMTLVMAEDITNRFKPLAPEQISEEIDINKCISEAMKSMRLGELRELHLKTVLSEDLPKVLASQPLRLVFENLISNALQAMHSRGSLELSTRVSKDGQWVEAVVSDSGPGLAVGMNKDEIFNFGVTSRKGGLGFGLWWCDTFLRRWGGDIRLDENSKAGCKFLVRLPTVEYNLPMGSQV